MSASASTVTRCSKRHLALVLACFPLAVAGQVIPDGLLARLDAVRQEEQVPAMGLALVSTRQTLHVGAYGVRDLQSKEPVDEETVFRVGSITKTFTSLGALVLQERGLLRLEDPVTKHLDGAATLDNPWAEDAPVRIAHLLEHTAGLQDMLADEWAVREPMSLDQALALRPTSRRLHWPPGTHSSYSNSGAGVAAKVFEEVTGQAFEPFMEKVLFTPLGLESATLSPTPRTLAHLAQGYDRDGRTPMAYWHMLYPAFGALNLTPKDMVPLLQLLLGEGEVEGRRLLARESIARLESPRTTLAAKAGLTTWGYGLGNYTWARKGVVWHGHGGDADGYLAHYGYSRDLDRGYFLVITAFRKASLRRLRRVIEDALAQEAASPGRSTPPAATVAPSELEAYVGEYRSATTRFAGSPGKRMVIEREGGRLLTRIDDGPPRPLLAVSDHTFRRPWEPVATSAFVRDREGTLYLQGDMGNFQRVTP